MKFTINGRNLVIVARGGGGALVVEAADLGELVVTAQHALGVDVCRSCFHDQCSCECAVCVAAAKFQRPAGERLCDCYSCTRLRAASKERA